MRIPGSQLGLGLVLPPSLAEADFLEAAENAEALAWLRRWPDWPGNALLLHGPPGCGKTHLAHVWAARAGARIVVGAGVTVAGVADLAAAALAVDDADGIVDPAALLHLVNLQRERGYSLLLTASHSAARWPGDLADLTSRLRAMPAAELREPGDDLLAAVMLKLFADRQLPVAAEVIAYLLPRIERSFAAARQWVARIDAAAIAAQRPITLALVRQVLEDADQS